MSQFRIEKDSLGEVQVPFDALYGAQTQRAIENFDYSARIMPRSFIIALAHIKKAAARANQQLNCLETNMANAIIEACDEILKGEHLSQFPVSVFQTGSGTSTNMNMNEVLANLANRQPNTSTQIHANDHVNYGQSSNDVIPSSVQVSSLLLLVECLFPAIDKTVEQLSLLSDQYKNTIKTGRTHLMDAMPLSLGDEFSTWCYQLNEGRERLVSSLGRLCELPLGGTAIGTGINRHREFADKACAFLAEQTQLPIKASKNFASRISSQDPVLEIHGQLKVLATCMMKMVNDLRWMNSGPTCGLGEIQLKALQPGSSIMPGKVNPVIPESIAMMCTEVMGNDVMLTIANQSGNFQLNVMLPLIADKMNTSTLLLSNALYALAEKALVGISVNKEKLEEQQHKNPILVTALNTLIGYEKAAMIAKTAIKENRNIIDVAEEKTQLSRKELESLLSPEKLAKPFD